MSTFLCTACGLTNDSGDACARCGALRPSDAASLPSSAPGVSPFQPPAAPNPYAPNFPAAAPPSSPPNPYQSSLSFSGYADAPAYGLPKPYAPFAATLDNTPELEEANARIKKAWISGVVVGSLTFLVMAVVVGLGLDVGGIDAWLLVDVVIIFGLTFGVYRKSRTCAILLFSYYLLSKVIGFIESGRAGGIIITALFLFYFARGIQGTFTYHRLKRAAERG
jgi:hypothetical protein